VLPHRRAGRDPRARVPGPRGGGAADRAKLRNNTGNGIRNSLHGKRLAIDLQLFDSAGRWITEVYPYQLVGEFWESLGPDHRWGGRFGDTPHFSIEHEGVR
jgi:hypothetical protein